MTSARLTDDGGRFCHRRRLVLSGTPLQNQAVELWSLFDFLMPGYLGTHAQFNAECAEIAASHSTSARSAYDGGHFSRRYARPIQASLGARAADAEHARGEAALARLHRQMLPFCLRRTKERVRRDHG
jgi:TATA-binding protein-associated factor